MISTDRFSDVKSVADISYPIKNKDECYSFYSGALSLGDGCPAWNYTYQHAGVTMGLVLTSRT